MMLRLSEAVTPTIPAAPALAIAVFTVVAVAAVAITGWVLILRWMSRRG